MAELKPRNHKWPNPRKTKDGAPPPLQPLFASRVEQEIRDSVEEWLEEAGWTKRQLTEFALSEVIDKIDPQKARQMLSKANKSLIPG